MEIVTIKFAIAKILGYTDQQVTVIYLRDNNLAGKVFGYWTVLRPVTLKGPIDNSCPLKYLCKCVCGKQKEVNAKTLLNGKSLSCGCKRTENQTDDQIKGRLLGQQITNKLHEERLALTYGKQEANKNSKTGVRGVCPYGRNQWRATITAAGTQYELGIFDDLQKAIVARKQAEEELHGPLIKKAKKIKSDVLNKPPD